MTEEKLAEEYAKKFGDDNILHFGENLIDLTPIRRDSFLDGLKASKPKWHKVADGDLPKENHFILIFNKMTGYEIARHAPFREYLNDNWVTVDNRGISASFVIAWCELPKFEE